MAKKSSVEKQKKREHIVQINWAKRQKLKEQASNIHSSEEERHAARVAINKMPRNSSPIRLRNRCKLTGRARGYLRQFGLSRLCFREMALMGLIPGITKASW